MGPVGKFWRLPAADRTLLIKTVLWLGATRVALWLLPLRVVRRLLAPTARSRRSGGGSPPSRDRIVWAVAVARRLVPYATCLPQALAAEALLARAGYAVDLRIGVVKTAAGGLTAHAWVESDGRVVVGDLKTLSRFAPLPPLPSARA